jgi:hypothetical protein
MCVNKQGTQKGELLFVKVTWHFDKTVFEQADTYKPHAAISASQTCARF